jgi:coproporphyrinogen III oxidase-like Fe-S oxidoreductase
MDIVRAAGFDVVDVDLIFAIPGQTTDKGAYYYHYIEQAYTMKYIDKMWNIFSKQAFPQKITLK